MATNDTVPLYDAAGQEWHVPMEALSVEPTAGEKTRRLYHPQTGAVYEVPERLFEQQPPKPNTLGNFSRSPTAQEQQLFIFLQDDRIPQKLRDKFFILSYRLALTKITSPEAARKMQMKIENLLRAAYITGELEEGISYLDLEMLEFAAGDVELNRSITYDGKPTERELWTIQTVNQNVRQTGESEAQRGGGILGAVHALFKGRMNS